MFVVEELQPKALEVEGFVDTLLGLPLTVQTQFLLMCASADLISSRI